MNFKLLVFVLLMTVFLVDSEFAFARGGGGSRTRSTHASRSINSSSNSSVRVKSFQKKNGTYVQSHYRSKANKTKKDNWSNKGNVNPYTGKSGSKNN